MSCIGRVDGGEPEAPAVFLEFGEFGDFSDFSDFREFIEFGDFSEFFELGEFSEFSVFGEFRAGKGEGGWWGGGGGPARRAAAAATVRSFSVTTCRARLRRPAAGHGRRARPSRLSVGMTRNVSDDPE